MVIFFQIHTLLTSFRNIFKFLIYLGEYGLCAIVHIMIQYGGRDEVTWTSWLQFGCHLKCKWIFKWGSVMILWFPLISYNENYDYFAGPGGELSSKNNSSKCWLCFRLFLWRTQKWLSDKIFVAPLIFLKEKKGKYCL